jgi:hypothetical protein
MTRRPHIEATITGPQGWLLPWHATYRVGICMVEEGSLAWTKRGIERKALRAIRRLERDEQRHNTAYTIDDSVL